MAGPVHETAAEVQTIATKRSAEADPEPSPVAKRPTEVPQQKEQEAQPAQDTANVNGVEGGEEKTTPQIQAPAAATENGKSAADAHEPASDKADNVESVEKVAPLNDETRTQAGEEVKVGAGNGVDPAAIASQLADEAAAAQVEADKAAKVASEKQTEALKALQSAAKVSGDHVESAQPAAEEPIKVEKLAAQEPANGTHVEDAAPQSAAQSEKASEEAGVKVADAPAHVTPDVSSNESSVAPEANLPPPTEVLMPANPLEQTAQTPLIGNIPPQAVESLQAAAHQAASVVPLQPTQEVLEQEMAVRTTPLAQPVDVGVAPMEE